jgi:hypothetical protein
MSGKDNLKPIKTVDEAREKGRRGGIKSGKARREKKLMSEIYAEFLAKEHDIVDATGKKKKLIGHELVNRVMNKVISRADSASVGLLKEIREGTEGRNVHHDGGIKIIFEDDDK